LISPSSSPRKRTPQWEGGEKGRIKGEIEPEVERMNKLDHVQKEELEEKRKKRKAFLLTCLKSPARERKVLVGARILHGWFAEKSMENFPGKLAAVTSV